MILGIVGKVGSGKSLCVRYVVENYPSIFFSCDKIAKEMIAKGEIDYRIDNPGDFFTNENLQEECRKVVHNRVFKRIFENISNYLEQDKNKKTIFVIETALPNKEFMEYCDKVICIENTYEKKKEILKEHRGYEDNQTKLIYESQKFYEKFYDMADYMIVNNGTKEEYLNKVKEVVDEICISCQ